MKAPKGLLPGEIPKHLNFVSGTARYFDAYNADFNFTLKKWQSKKNIKDIQAMKYNSASWIIKFSFTSSQKFVNSTRKHRPWLLPGNVAGACESSRWMATLLDVQALGLFAGDQNCGYSSRNKVPPSTGYQ